MNTLDRLNKLIIAFLAFIAGVMITVLIAYVKSSSGNEILKLAMYAMILIKKGGVFAGFSFVLIIAYFIFCKIRKHYEEIEVSKMYEEQNRKLERQIINGAELKAKDIINTAIEKQKEVEILKSRIEKDYLELKYRMENVKALEQELEEKKEKYLEEIEGLKIKNKHLKGFLQNKWQDYLKTLKEENKGRAKRTEKKLKQIYVEYLE